MTHKMGIQLLFIAFLSVGVFNTVAQIGHFTVVSLCLSWIESEAGVDLVLIETSLLFLCKCILVSIRWDDLHKKSNEVSIKTRSTPASLTIQGQVTKGTTVKWPVGNTINQ